MLDKRIGLIQTLEDIQYLNQSAKVEAELILSQLKNLLISEGLPDETTATLLNEISTQFGSLSARINVIEKMINSINYISVPKPKESDSKTQEFSEMLPINMTVPISVLVTNKKLLPIEISENNIKYSWTGADSEIEFNFTLNRSGALELKIPIFAQIKPEFVKDLKILIDGQQVTHRYWKGGPLLVISCILPPADNQNKTKVTITLPHTYSPKELGLSEDYRKLGIAIIEFRFAKPDGLLERIFKRLSQKV